MNIPSMHDRDWARLFFAELRDVAFQHAVRARLAAIRDAPYRERLAAVASFGGLLRSCRSQARLRLAAAMMEQLQIPPTLHVARRVMQTTFGEAAANGTLDRRFAQPGRDAHEKHMAEARRILLQRPDQVERYARLYDGYCRALQRTVHKLKRQR